LNETIIAAREVVGVGMVGSSWNGRVGPTMLSPNFPPD
jgi:hypothetical protein